MGRIVNDGLDGTNCHLSGHPLLGLSVTESLDADYATASAVCLAVGAPHATGATVTTTEGGVGTGSWVVEDPVTLKSGEKTWRSKAGAPFAHIPYVTYKLRRKGYHEARATLSRANLGADNFPPKFWSVPYQRYQSDMTLRMLAAGELPNTYDAFGGITQIGGYAEYQRRMSGVQVVASGTDIIRRLCALVGLPVAFKAQCPAVVDEYLPVNKPLVTAVKEVASWSGCSVYLDRTGTLQVFDFSAAFAGLPTARPAAVMEQEVHDALYSATAVTVVGEARAWSNKYDPKVNGFVPTEYTQPVEWTEAIAATPGTRHIEERIEIREYSITSALAQKIARERLNRVTAESGQRRYRGPADDCQGIKPLTHRVLSVTRSLEWGGDGYRYDIDIVEPGSLVSWVGPTAPSENPADSWWRP